MVTVAGVAGAQTAQIVCVNQVATLRVGYPAGGDSGKPGAFWMGIAAPDYSAGWSVNLSGNWQQYQGGLVVPAGRFDNGVPPSIQVNVALPGAPTNTYAYQGWIVGAGTGILTQNALTLIANRRNVLEQVKAGRIAAGTWSQMYESDDTYRLALAQSDMTANKKYAQLLTIPPIDCTPPSGSDH
ncbi:hypothetical protein DBB29_00675 [Pandoraea cepalis]|uniref:Uncharacterized protein n=1 Tax=Pandoraea cepalis TaxID=2508294 RepID=A0AAW7MGX1_9BURK|nr:hypothetical protein [Pandoraea cepalis]MDN4576647.1 hypothetical protein [Pandoraea cepalis]